jgi:hypothetical protein
LLNFMVNEWKRHQKWKDMLAEKIRSPKA